MGRWLVVVVTQRGLMARIITGTLGTEREAMIDKPKIPKFSSESEEADWWYANREWVEQEFEQAAREGRLKQGSTVLNRIRAATGSNSLTDPLSADDLSKLRNLAAQQGQDEAAYAGALLHEALEQESRQSRT